MSKKNLNKKNKKSKKNQRNPYAAIRRPICLQPPMYKEQVVRRWSIRSVLSGNPANSMIFTVSQLSAHLGVIATSAIACSLLCDQLRINRVCVWGPVTTAGTPVTVNLKFVDDPASNTQSGPPKTVSGTSSNITEYAYACLEPPTDNSSIFSQWADANLNTNWIVITAPVGSILQIWYDFIIDDIGATQAGPVIAGATAGNIYHKNMLVGAVVWTAVSPLNSI